MGQVTHSRGSCGYFSKNRRKRSILRSYGLKIQQAHVLSTLHARSREG